jgi:TRAP-type C4-dicarboxylate transport system substrate-binding protein
MLMLVLTACGGGTSAPPADSGTASSGSDSTAAATTPASDEAIELKFVAPDTANGTDIIYFDAWRKFLYNESGGRLILTEYGNGALVPAGEELAALRDGLADIGKIDSMWATGEIELNQAVCLPDTVDWPGALQSADIHMQLYEEFPELKAEFEKNGVMFLFPHYGGPTQLQTTKKPVHTLDDLKGLNQIEVGPYASEAAKLLGMSPLSFPISENADALMKGVADGISLNYNAVGNYYSDSINYSTLCGLVQPSTNYTCFNPESWAKLPADIQALFQGENIRKAYTVANYLRDRGDIDGRAKLADKFEKNGLPEVYVLPDDELAKWREIVSPVKNIWIDSVGADIGSSIQARLTEIRPDHVWTDAKAAEAEAIIAEWQALPLDLPNAIANP